MLLVAAKDFVAIASDRLDGADAIAAFRGGGNEGNTLGAEIARRALPAPNGEEPH